ncbi:malto-oligosyltrehalose synthase [Halomonas korlensis]|uniref:(1->4)-alpha-D-glucan 1-alpha-D-glucosylmutase n=1 Tax=Halomonas korlensis TaxID=463301 RepID=A0A1I7G9D0_9GAMM|nr:malto-oligosyltrehalose synthase [Halomonas korlensis]SFU44886.1 (1->4)-alpha-D-glucan 1-alpha-D-glucosylmutase [Halomonas korlensis]
MNPIRATLRLQFHRGFTLDDAAEWVDDYAALGVSHLYASPLQTSRAGSPHGYDGIDPTRLDPELGGEAALERLVQRLRAKGMGLILDIVPNHVAVGGSENRWWQDVMAWGQQSPFAAFFDIDWASPDPLLYGKLLVPFLGEPYADVLQSGQLMLRYAPSSASFHLEYHEHRFPLDPRHYGELLRHVEHGALRDMARRFDELATREDAYTAVEPLREALRELAADPAARDSLEHAMRRFDGRDPLGARRLHDLLEKQSYRLAWWRTGSDEINWRRFFDITELGGLRVELPEVFEATHALVFGLVEAGWIDGLRVDHVDGLADPAGYCRRLRARLDALEARRPPEVPRRVALYVEKILAADEPLHDDWGVDGTTGYEFMNQVSGLQHDPEGAAPLRTLWREETGRDDDFLVEVRLARGEILETALASEFAACAQALHDVARYSLSSRDITLGAIQRTLRALIVHFPVYRTYADDGGRPAQDEGFFQQALNGARGEVRPPEVAVLEQLERWLGGEAPADCDDDQERELRRRAIVRFQQLTSPVAAKAVEDTAGYRSAVLISRNDVGFDPEHFSHSPADFHKACRQRRERFPATLLATATHDHKRGEDVRARLAVISEQAQDIAERMRRWRIEAAAWRQLLPSGPAPSPADELMLYQLLLGAWPPTLSADDDEGMEGFEQRLGQWQVKALREAKLRSHWLWPDEAYESACQAYLQRLLGDPTWRAELAEAARRLDVPGAINGLVQVVLRMTVPGVPDLYQGCDYWDYSLVDPDNRREVDYAVRSATLQADEAPVDALAHWQDGQVKQAVLVRLMALRQAQPRLFEAGDYQPLVIDGARATQVVAFVRRHGDQAVLVVVPRLVSRWLAGAPHPVIPPACWENTRIHLTPALQGQWREVLTDVSLSLAEEALSPAELLADFPVGVWVHGADQRPEEKGEDVVSDHQGGHEHG